VIPETIATRPRQSTRRISASRARRHTSPGRALENGSGMMKPGGGATRALTMPKCTKTAGWE
jgi:hypothetical protein